MPTYTFNITEQQQITTAFNQGPATIGLPGNHIQLYSTISTILSTDTGGGAPDSNAEVKPVRIWFDGATKVNAGQGVFSTLIREYTQTQGELHWKRRFTDSQDPNVISEIQEASNQVARNAQQSLLDNLWTLQAIDAIANNDASGVGEVLFDFVSGDTINSNSLLNPLGQNAAWSGTLLFSSFDDPSNPNVTVDETGRLISTGSSATQADTLDDWRNVLYAHHSYNTALIEAGLEGASDILTMSELGNLGQAAKTFFEVCMLSGRCDASIATAVKGQVAQDAFDPGLLYGEYRTLNLLKSAESGVINTDALNLIVTNNFAKKANNLFGNPGPQNQSIPATVHRVDDLVAQAQSGELLAKKSLSALSPFKVDNGMVVNSIVTNKYWSDRGLMTKARLIFDAKGSPYVGTVSSSEFTASYQFTDVKSGISFNVDNNFLPFVDFVQIKFGSNTADNLVGASDDDSLYGADGADTLNGMDGNDFLSGGNGSVTIES